MWCIAELLQNYCSTIAEQCLPIDCKKFLPFDETRICMTIITRRTPRHYSEPNDSILDAIRCSFSK